jgi:hypothetical protein
MIGDGNEEKELEKESWGSFSDMVPWTALIQAAH